MGLRGCGQVPGYGGSYVLVIELMGDSEVHYGKRIAALEKGFYGYVGSARGPGGIRGRACREVVRPRWHVDHLLLRGVRAGACWSAGLSEAELAGAMAERFKEAAPGFGNTDTGGASHLFELGEGWMYELEALGLMCVQL